jgi:mono/diheme cytochrome c family protein
VLVELSTPQCALCHTLAAAGATGKIGPNLNQLKPTEDNVKVVVTQGFENMPAYGDMLSQDPIDAVSRFVAAPGDNQAPKPRFDVAIMRD